MTREVHILGQAIVKYDTPQHVVDEINKVYDERKTRELPATNKFLAGKIKSEHTLYHNEMNDASKNFNNVSSESLNWFQNQFEDYLGIVEKLSITIRLSSIWVNEMYANEYNPIHTHSSKFLRLGCHQ